MNSIDNDNHNDNKYSNVKHFHSHSKGILTEVLTTSVTRWDGHLNDRSMRDHTRCGGFEGFVRIWLCSLMSRFGTRLICAEC